MSVRATVTVLLTAAVLMMSLTAAAGAVLYSRLSVYAKQYRFYLEQQNFLQALADYNATAEEYRRQGVFAFAKRSFRRRILRLMFPKTPTTTIIGIITSSRPMNSFFIRRTNMQPTTVCTAYLSITMP